MRGEQSFLRRDLSAGRGSPPHARGAVGCKELTGPVVGITPACAGSSQYCICPVMTTRDHPRMRGEQSLLGFIPIGVGGSPPHARGAVIPHQGADLEARITPACAGSRTQNRTGAEPAGDHPRMRGEQYNTRQVHEWKKGSPPHARGAGRRCAHRHDLAGITPACAGSSGPRRWRRTAARDHPRMRGEQSTPA